MNLPFLNDMKNHQKTMQHSWLGMPSQEECLRRLRTSYAKNLQVMFWDD